VISVFNCAIKIVYVLGPAISQLFSHRHLIVEEHYGVEFNRCGQNLSSYSCL
jgi:hypothetical protein